jgi:hypothetical protein
VDMSRGYLTRALLGLYTEILPQKADLLNEGSFLPEAAKPLIFQTFQRKASVCGRPR